MARATEPWPLAAACCRRASCCPLVHSIQEDMKGSSSGTHDSFLTPPSAGPVSGVGPHLGSLHQMVLLDESLPSHQGSEPRTLKLASRTGCIAQAGRRGLLWHSDRFFCVTTPTIATVSAVCHPEPPAPRASRPIRVPEDEQSCGVACSRGERRRAASSDAFLRSL